MNRIIQKIFVLLGTLSFGVLAVAAPGTVKIHVTLFPVGSFDAVSKVLEGKALVSSGAVTAGPISIAMATFDTDNDLRNEHMRNRYLEVEKFPKAELSDVQGKEGKFTAKLNWRKVIQTVGGTYEVDGPNVHAKFALKASDFAIAKTSYMGVGAKDEVGVDVVIPTGETPQSKK